jgi:hypothetical protein
MLRSVFLHKPKFIGINRTAKGSANAFTDGFRRRTADGSMTVARSRMHSTIRELFHGNLEYMAKMSKENPGLLPTLAKEGQRQFVTSEILYQKGSFVTPS